MLIIENCMLKEEFEEKKKKTQQTIGYLIFVFCVCLYGGLRIGLM